MTGGRRWRQKGEGLGSLRYEMLAMSLTEASAFAERQAKLAHEHAERCAQHLALCAMKELLDQGETRMCRLRGDLRFHPDGPTINHRLVAAAQGKPTAKLTDAEVRDAVWGWAGRPDLSTGWQPLSWAGPAPAPPFTPGMHPQLVPWFGPWPSKPKAVPQDTIARQFAMNCETWLGDLLLSVLVRDLARIAARDSVRFELEFSFNGRIDTLPSTAETRQAVDDSRLQQLQMLARPARRYHFTPEGLQLR